MDVHSTEKFQGPFLLFKWNISMALNTTLNFININKIHA